MTEKIVIVATFFKMDSLPHELLVRVCSFLCTVSLCRLCGASKTVRIALKDDSDAWENALQSMWWYPYDMLKRHDNFTFWCSQYAIRTVPPPNGYLLYREVGSINNYYSFEFCPVQPIDNGTYVVWYSTASLYVPPSTSYNDESILNNFTRNIASRKNMMKKYACFVCPDSGRFHCMNVSPSGTVITSHGGFLCLNFKYESGIHLGMLYVNLTTQTVHCSRLQYEMQSLVHPSTGRHWIVDQMLREYMEGVE